MNIKDLARISDSKAPSKGTMAKGMSLRRKLKDSTSTRSAIQAAVDALNDTEVTTVLDTIVDTLADTANRLDKSIMDSRKRRADNARKRIAKRKDARRKVKDAEELEEETEEFAGAGQEPIPSMPPVDVPAEDGAHFDFSAGGSDTVVGEWVVPDGKFILYLYSDGNYEVKHITAKNERNASFVACPEGFEIRLGAGDLAEDLKAKNAGDVHVDEAQIFQLVDLFVQYVILRDAEIGDAVKLRNFNSLTNAKVRDAKKPEDPKKAEPQKGRKRVTKKEDKGKK